jgi:site-specific recombinase XerD
MKYMKARSREKKVGRESMELIMPKASDPELQTAVSNWTDATTLTESARQEDIRRDKTNAVLSFFVFCGKTPEEVTTTDIKMWQEEMEGKGLAATTVYTRVCHLSWFFRWLMKDPVLGQVIRSNPVGYAHPKAPKPYQTRSAEALTKKQTAALLKVAEVRADSGDLTGKRDYWTTCEAAGGCMS